jgi:hypothetical protein
MVDFCILGQIMLDLLEVMKCSEAESKDFAGTTDLCGGRSVMIVPTATVIP